MLPQSVAKVNSVFVIHLNNSKELCWLIYLIIYSDCRQLSDFFIEGQKKPQRYFKQRSGQQNFGDRNRRFPKMITKERPFSWWLSLNVGQPMKITCRSLFFIELSVIWAISELRIFSKLKLQHKQKKFCSKFNECYIADTIAQSISFGIGFSLV